jgi:hypothetical protein
MKVIDLANLVTVINHIPVVINDKSVTNRDEFSVLNNARTALNKKFVEGVKGLNVETLFEKSVKIEDSAEVIGPVGVRAVGVTGISSEMVSMYERVSTTASASGTSGEPEKRQLELPLGPTGSEGPTVGVTGPGVIESNRKGPDPEYLEALKRQKEALKNQGRSNRKVSKDDSQKG